MIYVRHADERGRADFGWLKSQHSFSFGKYYDPRFMGVSALRVINDDRVAPSAGFDTHGHKDMEIISYVISGTIAHKDSFGHVKTCRPVSSNLCLPGRGSITVSTMPRQLNHCISCRSGSNRAARVAPRVISKKPLPRVRP